MTKTGLMRCRFCGFVAALLMAITALTLIFDNQIERVPFLYTDQSILIRGTILFPSYFMLFALGLPWREKGLMKVGNRDAPVSVRLGALSLMAAGMAWSSIGLAVCLASASNGPISRQDYRIDKISCLRDLCRIKLTPPPSNKSSVLQLPLGKTENIDLAVGDMINVEAKTTPFGEVALSINAKSHLFQL